MISSVYCESGIETHPNGSLLLLLGKFQVFTARAVLRREENVVCNDYFIFQVFTARAVLRHDISIAGSEFNSLFQVFTARAVLRQNCCCIPWLTSISSVYCESGIETLIEQVSKYFLVFQVFTARAVLRQDCRKLCF